MRWRRPASRPRRRGGVDRTGQTLTRRDGVYRRLPFCWRRRRRRRRRVNKGPRRGRARRRRGGGLSEPRWSSCPCWRCSRGPARCRTDVLPRDGLAMATLFILLQDVCASNGASVLYPRRRRSPGAAATGRAQKRTNGPMARTAPRTMRISGCTSRSRRLATPWPPGQGSLHRTWAQRTAVSGTVRRRRGVDGLVLPPRRRERDEDLRCVMYATFASEGDHRVRWRHQSRRRLGEFPPARR